VEPERSAGTFGHLPMIRDRDGLAARVVVGHER
jgi:hypothetical protein